MIKLVDVAVVDLDALLNKPEKCWMSRHGSLGCVANK